MTLLQVVVLAIVQGLTEFLPISSSGHLILVPSLLGWPDQGLAFDVAVHFGTLLAVLWYFRQDLTAMALDGTRALFGGERTLNATLAFLIALATIPVGLVGFLANDLIETYLRSPRIIAATTIGFGIVLWWADAAGTKTRAEHTATWRDALAIGCAQILALIPGTSRSGITMTAGLAIGLTREGASRFSFLLAVPIIALAAGLHTVKLIGAAEPVQWGQLLVAVVVSAVAAYLCIRLFLQFINRTGMLPFALYRIVLGVIILLLLR